MKIIDADGHVEESSQTFDKPYWDDVKLADRKPKVVQGEHGPFFLIDGQIVPRLAGPGA